MLHHHLISNATLLRADPTRTTGIVRRFVADLRRRVRKLIVATHNFLDTEDELGLKEHTTLVRMARRTYAFRTDAEKLKAFNDWFAQQVKLDVLSIPFGIDPSRPWTAEYVESAYKRGLINAYLGSKQGKFADDLGLGDVSQAEFLRDAFLAPEAVAKIRLLATRSFEELKGVTGQMGASMNRILAQGMAEGRNPRDIATTMRKSLATITQQRAELIARTEIIRSHSEGSLDGFEKLGVKELNLQVEWTTAGDDRVCFPAWTMVETADGPRPIQAVLPGMKVKTRSGFRKVIGAGSRKFSGKMATIATNQGSVIATADHPFWTINRGWVDAGSLTNHDLLYSVGDKQVKVGRVINFILSDPDNLPASIGQESILSFVKCQIPMPIVSIYFKRDSDCGQQEVHGISTDLSFLRKVYAQAYQRFTNLLFDRRFRLGSSIACERAESAAGSWTFSQSCIASRASDKDRRAAAFLGAEWAIHIPRLVRSFVNKKFSATLARFPSPTFPLNFAGDGAVGISVGNAGFNGENASTTRTSFLRWFTPSGLVAFIGAIAARVSSSIDRPCATIDQFPTNQARYCLSISTALCVAGMAAKPFKASSLLGFVMNLVNLLALVAGKFKRHCYPWLTKLSVISHRLSSTPLTVYDLTVDIEPEFFANGFLVHNCPQCSEHEGEVFTIDEARGLIPLYPRCRCNWSSRTEP